MFKRICPALWLALVFAASASAATNVPTPLVREAGSTRRLSSATGGSPADRKLALRESALAALRQVRVEGDAVVASFPVDVDADADLEIHRFEVFTPDAEILAVGEGGAKSPLPRPDVAFFEGRVAGEPDSRVFLAAYPHSLHGYVERAERIAAIGPDGGWFSETPGHTLHRMSREDLAARTRGWLCRSDELSLPPRAGGPSPQITDTGQKFEVTIAVDTDFELYQLFGSNLTAEENYIANEVAASSAIYWRDLITRLKIGSLYTYTSSSDPWTATDSLSALYEVGDYWHANHAGVSRSTVLFLSAKNLGGGIAWLGTICGPDFSTGSHWGGGYAVVGDIAADIANFHNPGVGTGADLWDIDAVAHEMGHNFGSVHTHCYSPPIDMCYNQEAGCYSGSVVDPGVEGGTIMSYCQLLGWDRILLAFHSRCITEQLRPTILNASVSYPSCMRPGAYLDVVVGSTAEASIYKIAAWGITGGCGVQLFCPNADVTRAQMAVFLESALGQYTPPTGRPQTFADVPPGSFGYDFIEDAVSRGITSGCGGGDFCPTANIQRSQMAVFLLRAQHGSTYVPPPAIGIFGDVPASNSFAPWIEQLYNEGVTGGCSTNPLLFCPSNPVTRAEMAIFLVAAFGL